MPARSKKSIASKKNAAKRWNQAHPAPVVQVSPVAPNTPAADVQHAFHDNEYVAQWLDEADFDDGMLDWVNVLDSEHQHHE